MIQFLGKASADLDWEYRGMRVLTMENDYMMARILLDKGSDIFELTFKPLSTDVLWHSSNGYHNPREIAQSIATPDGSFLDLYGGGWNDIFPNYGFASSNLGSKWGLHGESSILPWKCSLGRKPADGESASADLELDCIRYPLESKKTIKISSKDASLQIFEDISNVGEQKAEFSWAQHIAFGEPFVSPQLTIDIFATRGKTHNYEMAQERVERNKEFEWPLAPGKDGLSVDLSKLPNRSERIQEDLVLSGLNERRYVLYNGKLDLGVEVKWNEAFPHLWYWLNWGALDYPWFGRARTLALEPTTSTEGGGLSDQIKSGELIILEPAGKVHGEIELRMFQKNKA